MGFLFFGRKKKKAQPVQETKPVEETKPAEEVKVTEPAEEAETADEKKKAKEATRVYHVVKRPEDGKWAVKFAGGEKVIKLFDTQKEAIEYTKKMAANQEGAMLVHNSKGKAKGRIKEK